MNLPEEYQHLSNLSVMAVKTAKKLMAEIYDKPPELKLCSVSQNSDGVAPFMDVLVCGAGDIIFTKDTVLDAIDQTISDLGGGPFTLQEFSTKVNEGDFIHLINHLNGVCIDEYYRVYELTSPLPAIERIHLTKSGVDFSVAGEGFVAGIEDLSIRFLDPTEKNTMLKRFIGPDEFDAVIDVLDYGILTGLAAAIQKGKSVKAERFGDLASFKINMVIDGDTKEESRVPISLTEAAAVTILSSELDIFTPDTVLTNGMKSRLVRKAVFEKNYLIDTAEVKFEYKDGDFIASYEDDNIDRLEERIPLTLPKRFSQDLVKEAKERDIDDVLNYFTKKESQQ